MLSSNFSLNIIVLLVTQTDACYIKSKNNSQYFINVLEVAPTVPHNMNYIDAKIPNNMQDHCFSIY